MSVSTTQLTYPDVGVAIAIDVGPSGVVTLKIIPIEASKPAVAVPDQGSATTRSRHKPAALIGSIPRKRKIAPAPTAEGEVQAPRKRGRPRKVQADVAGAATTTAAVPPPPPPPPPSLTEDFEPAV